MNFFQPFPEVNTFLFRREFPMLTGNSCKNSTFFQAFIHKSYMVNILITGKRRISNNFSVMSYTVFRKIFIKQYYVIKCMKKLPCFPASVHSIQLLLTGTTGESLLSEHHVRHLVQVRYLFREFHRQALPASLQYQQVFQRTENLLQIASLTFFQDGEHTFRIKRKCESLYLTSLP